ncbi:hypothetical protein DERP_011869 [Dermatophagoides pteronyssinus]|uniref:Uncharacterized protein n=1 Tax=Dermatophagoides pteronyssinus TaxID=6956 RepID=A0ABQ8JS75_DERPT|nr:hypothetical protein DERP_011869 [Dermatophagoides pteronyssinus]
MYNVNNTTNFQKCNDSKSILIFLKIPILDIELDWIWIIQPSPKMSSRQINQDELGINQEHHQCDQHYREFY